jgi:hypothetical protein
MQQGVIGDRVIIMAGTRRTKHSLKSAELD